MHGLRDKNRLQRADAEDSEAFPITQPNQFHTEPVIRLAFRSYGAKQARGDGIDDTHRGLEVLDAVGGAVVALQADKADAFLLDPALKGAKPRWEIESFASCKVFGLKVLAQHCDVGI